MMKKTWSNKWVSSKQPRKQRKYRHNAPLHIKHKLVSAHMSPELRRRYNKRSLPVRKGDEVEIMRGSSKGLRGIVERVDLKKCKVYIENIKVKKVDGSEVLKAVEPSNLKIISLTTDDKRRKMVFERVGKEKPKEEVKEITKQAAKKEQPEKSSEEKPKKRIEKRSK
jgi:large subunit ribosomal protein L24